LTKSTH